MTAHVAPSSPLLPSSQPFFFSGFHFPNYTPVPDQVFDELLTVLTGAELKVLLYICRRTFGFKKESDNISLSQMLFGLVKHDGTRLDAGTGLSKPTLLKALRDLQDKGIIEGTRRSSDEHGDEATNYRLRFADGVTPPAVPSRQHRAGGRSKNFTTGGKESLPGGRSTNLSSSVGKKVTPQETVVQETAKQKTEDTTVDRTVNQDVVVALQGQGISGRVATSLTAQYGRERVMEKMAFLAYLQVSEPEKLQNPRGWLRSAIEEDYAAPDGYRSVEEIAAEAAALRQAEAERQRLMQEQQLQAEAAQERQRQAEAARLTHWQTTYGTSQQEIALWTQIVDEFRLSTPAASFKKYVIDTVLLSLRDGQALIGLSHPLAREWLETHFLKKIERTLASYLGGRKVTVAFVDLAADGFDVPTVKP